MNELSAENLLPLLRTRRYGRSLDVRVSTESTNDDAKQAAAAQAANGHVVVADTQTRGRGSQGRSWSSASGDDLFLSIVDRPSVAFAELPPLTLAVGLGVAEAVDALSSNATNAVRSRVKWPNDVQINGRKCAGILIEATASGSTLESVVIGIGLNVNRMTFPDDLRDSATSLRIERGDSARIDRALALAQLLLHVETWVERFTRDGASAVVDALRDRLAMFGARATCADLEGIVRGVAASGALLLETRSGVREVIAGRLLPMA